MLTRYYLTNFLITNVIFILLIQGCASDNYPDQVYLQKPCMKLKNTINTILPVCVPGPDGGFTKESKDNCAVLKEECPEFNEWECMWYEYTNPKLSAPLQFPTCRLKYYARRYTWGEIYYTNQYGTGPNVANDIVEIHRFIKKKGAFPNEQEDWPKNVLDPMGERGLHWIDSPATLDKFTNTYYQPAVALLCENLQDTNGNCQKNVAQFIGDNYSFGIAKATRPEPSKKEKATNAAIKFSTVGVCAYIMVGNKRTPACRAVFVRKSSYVYYIYDGDDPSFLYTQSTKQQWLEAQIWQKTLGDPKTNKSAEFELRYAPFNYEPPSDQER